MPDKLDIDFFELSLFLGFPAFFAGLSFLAFWTIEISIVIFVLGLIGMASIHGHENSLFRIIGILIGTVSGASLAFALSLTSAQIIITSVIGALLGYLLARWGYWLLEVISHIY